MRIKKLQGNAILPRKAHAGDLGYDLFACEYGEILPDALVLVNTGVAIQFPANYGGIIKDRSSISTKYNVFTVAGVIDNGYTGEILVALFNASQKVFNYQPGDKIAQLVLIPTVDFHVVEVDEVLSADERGDNGFGSTGR